MTNSIIELHTQVPADLEGNVFGQFDEHLKLIERTLNVTLISRDGSLKILGTDGSATQAKKLIEELVTLAGKGNTITRQNVTYALSLAMEERNQVLTEIDKDFICNTIQGRPIKPKTLGQKEYVEQIRKKMIVFGIGPAGTGKTYLAMAMAVTAFRNEEVSRIILTRPAIEAGEKLGFLPGDLQSKVDPYLRPLYDALYQIMGADSFAKNMERGLIEVAPLAYMRGRTLDNAFIILALDPKPKRPPYTGTSLKAELFSAATTSRNSGSPKEPGSLVLSNTEMCFTVSGRAASRCLALKGRYRCTLTMPTFSPRAFRKSTVS